LLEVKLQEIKEIISGKKTKLEVLKNKKAEL
jgi:hypothetical protein